FVSGYDTIRRIRIVSQYECDFEPGDVSIVELNFTNSTKAAFVSASWSSSREILTEWILAIVTSITAQKRQIPIVVFVSEMFVDPEHLLSSNKRIRLSDLRQMILGSIPEISDNLLVLSLRARTQIWDLNDAFEFIYYVHSEGMVRWRRYPEFEVPNFFDHVKGIR
ncbi:hypothetical protein BVRB_023360, partial [Beta vulgaris subsp. vulgaris]